MVCVLLDFTAPRPIHKFIAASGNLKGVFYPKKPGCRFHIQNSERKVGAWQQLKTNAFHTIRSRHRPQPIIKKQSFFIISDVLKVTGKGLNAVGQRLFTHQHCCFYLPVQTWLFFFRLFPTWIICLMSIIQPYIHTTQNTKCAVVCVKCIH